MPPVSQPPAPFASLASASDPALRRSWSIARLFTAPFRDVDDRVFRLAAAIKAEREAREAAMADADAPRR